MSYIACKQLSAEWLAEHVGRVTASNMDAVEAVLKRKDGEAAVRFNYKVEKITEICTGVCVDKYVSKAMEFGLENEQFARAKYEVKTSTEVQEVGFFIHPRIDRFGASPDGIIGSDGGLEIKCPNSTTHIKYLLDGVVPEDYKPQMNAQMACTGRKWVDFVSYDPRMPEHLQLFIVRFMRDEAEIAKCEAAVEQFLAELDELMLRLPCANGDTATTNQLKQSLEAGLYV